MEIGSKGNSHEFRSERKGGSLLRGLRRPWDLRNSKSIWDVGSARMLAGLGFQALARSSAAPASALVEGTAGWHEMKRWHTRV
jgi:2-methylisocitrate lyase-like PEP mutase family enzyme